MPIKLMIYHQPQRKLMQIKSKHRWRNQLTLKADIKPIIPKLSPLYHVENRVANRSEKL